VLTTPAALQQPSLALEGRRRPALEQAKERRIKAGAVIRGRTFR